MSPRIYVAGASDDVDAIARWIQTLHAHGWIVTHDWTVDVRKNRVCVHCGQPQDVALVRCPRFAGDIAHRFRFRPLSFAEILHAARTDADAVRTADVVWLHCPSLDSTGAWVEWGIALERLHRDGPVKGPLLLVSGERADLDRCIFLSLVQHQFGGSDTHTPHQQAFEWLQASFAPSITPPPPEVRT